MSRIFISYRRQDTEGYVGRLYDNLLQVFDRNEIFMDVDNIPPGVDFVQALEDAVAACDVMLVMIGQQWAQIADDAGVRRLDQPDDFVRFEVATALKLEKRVIPVLVGQGTMPTAEVLPPDLLPLTRRNAIVLSHQRFAHDFEQLVAVIRAALVPQSFAKPAIDRIALEQKSLALKQIRDALMQATESPLYEYRNENRFFPVLGEGNADANILFLGEAPGVFEARNGRPFCGPSGDVLEALLNDIGLKREAVFITNLLLDHPGKRAPSAAEIDFYAPLIDQIIGIIQPRVIATLGRFAMQYLLKKLDLPEKRSKISELHGKLIQAQMPYGEVQIVPLYHPAVVLYSATQKDTLRQDFQKLKLFV